MNFLWKSVGELLEIFDFVNNPSSRHFILNLHVRGLVLVFILKDLPIGAVQTILFFEQEQGWRSGESAHLPPMWPGFDSRSRRHMWVEFVVGSRPCSERFFSGYSGFPLSSKTNISKFQFDLESVPN